jgi:hypothetical protein
VEKNEALGDADQRFHGVQYEWNIDFLPYVLAAFMFPAKPKGFGKG